MSYKMIEIDGDNAEDFSDYIDIDMQEQLDREFFRGIGAVDDSDSPVGAMVFELLDSESDEDTKSRIRLLKADSEDIENVILTEYKSKIEEEDVTESCFESSDKTMSDFLESNGFSMKVSEAMDIVLTVKDVKAVPLFAKERNFPPYIMSLSEVSAIQFRTFVKECLFKGHKGLLEDLAYISKSWFDQDLSSCIVTDGKVNGALLIKKAPSGLLFTMLFAAFGADSQQNLALLMGYSARKAIEDYPEDTKVVIRRHNVMVQKLAGKLFAGSKGEDVFMGKRSEE
ncbi:MAG: hypothetical protein K6A69_10190 [Lachnospiraceae bacterium]|nr:hypothetical protein [Lachnospiraceae bacterium]